MDRETLRCKRFGSLHKRNGQTIKPIIASTSWPASFLFWFLVICGRLVWLQVVNYGDYTQRAAKQQQRSIEVSPVRGNIYDRRGNELAMTVSVDSVFAVPSEVPDIHSAAQVLARVLKADAS